MNTSDFDELYHRAWRSDSPELADQVAAAMHAKHVDTPKVPEPTQAQQLLWVTQRAAELQARLHRKNGAMSEAIMWLSVGQRDRAQEALNRGLLDL